MVEIVGHRKEFWAFVRKGKKWNIASLIKEACVLVTSTKGKLEAHYERVSDPAHGWDFKVWLFSNLRFVRFLSECVCCRIEERRNIW